MSHPAPDTGFADSATCDDVSGGWLALVATPIGNLEDITLRAIRTLRAADLIAAEDTRRAATLCKRFEITTRRIAYHAHNEHRKTASLLDQVEAGQRVAVITDAGTPGVSDPGFLIVREAVARGIEPVILPGASSLTFAVAACGLPVDRFLFLGFPPVKSGRRRRVLETVAESEVTCFLFESPHRIGKLLTEIAEICGPQRRVAVLREATKIHEEVLRGTAAELTERTAARVWRGELVVAVAGA